MSKTCADSVIPQIVQSNIGEYENSLRNKERSVHILYEGGLISKKKYTSIHNSSDEVKESGNLKPKLNLRRNVMYPRLFHTSPCKVLSEALTLGRS